MTRRAVWHALSVVAVVLPICAACEARTAPSERPANDATVWRTLGAWSGRGNTQTESFTVDTGALRLRWQTRNETAPGAGRFRVSLHSAISGRALQTIVDRMGIGGDTSYLEDDPRVSYLVIESQDLDWIATLEEVTLSVTRPTSDGSDHHARDLIYAGPGPRAAWPALWRSRGRPQGD